MLESWIGVSIAMAVIVGATLVACFRVRATIIERRIARMMVASGIDEAVARQPQRYLGIDMKEVRRRCRNCPDPETCDRFLNGGAVPDNSFCPNAAGFHSLVDSKECRLRHDPRHRPGRRLDG